MSEHQEQNETIKDQFGKQAPSYAQLTRSGKNVLLERLVEVLAPTPADALLDVGCGPGRTSIAMAAYVGQVTGIDLTPEMLAQARAHQAASGVANIRWVEGDALPLPFADAAFSIVVTQATFHHFADPAAVLAEMQRVCAPGGRIAVIDLSFDPAKGPAFDQVEKVRDPSHLRVLPTEQVRALGRTAGLEELDVWSYSSPLPVEAVLATSVCGADAIAQVRDLYRADAVAGADRLGMSLRIEDGVLHAAYPMTMHAWRRP